jgi:hypothetical protein
VTFSRESLELFAHLLGQVSIPASAPDVVEQAQKIERAKQEITAALLPESNAGADQ